MLRARMFRSLIESRIRDQINGSTFVTPTSKNYLSNSNTAVKRLHMCELSFEFRFFFRACEGVLNSAFALLRCFFEQK